jgi:2-dehydro-3-deoxyglucarate aldolase/4-hydroxy-2-oxoheptanedioate aldolase
MRDNHVKRRLRAGQTCVGTIVFEFGTSGIARAAAAAGADFLFFDQEHTGWTSDVLRMLLATTRAVESVPIVRVPATQYHMISQALDLGAMGIVVPMVETVEQAQVIVRSAKYPPAGRRGAAFGVAHDDYLGGDVLTKMTSANEETMLVAQIETVTGLENVERIAAIPGIDVVWLGHFDLTASMGIPGQFGDPRYVAAVEWIAAAAAAAGKAAGFMVSSVDEAAFMLQKGFRCLAYWGDIWIYGQALRGGIDATRKAAAAIAAGAARG